MKPRGGQGKNGRLKCPLGFLVVLKAGKTGLNWVRKVAHSATELAAQSSLKLSQEA